MDIKDMIEWVKDLPLWQKITFGILAVGLLLFIWQPWKRGTEADTEENTEEAAEDYAYGFSYQTADASYAHMASAQTYQAQAQESAVAAAASAGAAQVAQVAAEAAADTATAAADQADADAGNGSGGGTAEVWNSYTVSKGDTLSRIFNRLGLNWKTLWNKGYIKIKSGNPNLIRTGEVIQYRMA